MLAVDVDQFVQPGRLSWATVAALPLIQSPAAALAVQMALEQQQLARCRCKPLLSSQGHAGCAGIRVGPRSRSAAAPSRTTPASARAPSTNCTSVDQDRLAGTGLARQQW